MSKYNDIRVGEGVLIVMFLLVLVLFLGIAGDMEYRDELRCYEPELNWDEEQKIVCK